MARRSALALTLGLLGLIPVLLGCRPNAQRPPADQAAASIVATATAAQPTGGTAPVFKDTARLYKFPVKKPIDPSIGDRAKVIDRAEVVDKAK
jgi:hypothetical protein